MKRKIAVIVGSRSDLAGGQCAEGLRVLQNAETEGTVEVIGVFAYSLHRNTEATLALLKELSTRGVDVIIVGAGLANHLTGTVDAYLRNEIGDMHAVVVGVAFEDHQYAERTRAAVESILYVPGTQVVFDNYVGATGFTRACRFTATGELPQIIGPAARRTERFTLEEALTLA